MNALAMLGRAVQSLFLPELCRCAVCGEERALVEGTGFCQSCWTALPHNEDPLTVKQGLVTISPFWYAGAAEELVKGLKFHNKRYMAQALGRVMAEACLQAGLTAEALVPVPLHPNRKRERGYNQSELLARSMAETLQTPVQPTWLRRVRDTEQQALLEALQRRANVQGAFAADGSVRGLTVCLVDDVTTTGCTLRAAADALEKQGAKVWVCTACRT